MASLAVLLLCLAAQAATAIRLPRFGPSSPSCDELIAGSVVRDDRRDGGWRFSPAPEGGAAWGRYQDGTLARSNFGQLRVSTSGEYSDSDQLFAAGYLEGYLTGPRIYDNFYNMRDYFTRVMGANIVEPMEWIEEQDRWLQSQCQALEEQQPHRQDGRFWQAVCLLLRQFDGLKAGYRARHAEVNDHSVMGHMSDWDFLFMSSNGDLYDIIDWLQPDQRPSWIQSGAEPQIPTVGRAGGGRHWAALEAAAQEDPAGAAARLFSKVALSGKCSALIKVASDLSDIFMGHSTWDTFTAMLRIYKHYHFNLTRLRPAASRLSFSSYPGELFSDDDFWLMDSGLVMMVTTNKVFNDDLFDQLDPRGSVLSWQRVRTANWLAADGADWVRLFRHHNSGTYNNQYMVVDLNRFTPGEPLRDGLLWVAEQIPGRVVAADLTSTLAFGYWPSFNVPYFPEIYNASGYPDFVSRLDRHGQHFGNTTHWLSYQNSPRAKILRRDQAGIADLEGLKAVMRSNRWKTDPFSERRPIAAVCGRGDLDPEYPVARGCYDTKVTSYSLARQMQAEAVNGPAADGWPWSLPQFRWDASAVANLTHRGQPERFGFSFERMDPFAPAPSQDAGCAGRQSGAAAAA